MDSSRQQIDLDSVLQELRILYHRATIASPSDVDLLAIDLFASMVQQYESIFYEATKIIAEKFKSSNADEVLLALNVLEECMSKCGPKFHSEIGKFRFLNELIRLVSPVYQGDKTPKKIRDKILDLMLLWTVNYPQETKIKEAYEMLLKRGVRHEFVKAVQIQSKNDTKPLPDRAPAQPDLSDKLKKLLQSTNPSDHKAANLLIQNMVKEKERRTEVQVRRKLQLKEVYENAYLLNEMLDQTGSASGAEVLTEDVLVTLNDLYEACKKLQPTILILVGDLNETDLLEEALEANDLLTEVLGKYSKSILKQSSDAHSSSSYLIPSVADASAPQMTTQNAMDELSEIFSAQSTEANPILMPDTSHNMNLLEPTLAPSSPASSDKSRNAIKELNISCAVTSPPSSGFDHLNGLRNDRAIPLPTLVPASSIATTADNAIKSQSRLVNFDSDITELVSGLKLNMGKQSTESYVNDPDLDDDKLLEEPDDVVPSPAINSEIDLLAHDFDPLAASQPSEARPTPKNEVSVKNGPENVNKPLSEIFIDLNSIQPNDEHPPRCILDESNGLKIMLNFTKDHPRPDVVVLVITTTNHNSLPLSNYQFEASVTKPCKIHLQKASGHELPAVKPFRPPSEDITQVLLLSNPEHNATKIMCIISYVLGNDPDPVKEFVEINDLPNLF